MPVVRLGVDWPRCQGRGLCHELAPELIDLDPWGYPVLTGSAVPEAALPRAREAVAACPHLALRLLPERD